MTGALAARAGAIPGLLCGGNNTVPLSPVPLPPVRCRARGPGRRRTPCWFGWRAVARVAGAAGRHGALPAAGLDGCLVAGRQGRHVHPLGRVCRTSPRGVVHAGRPDHTECVPRVSDQSLAAAVHRRRIRPRRVGQAGPGHGRTVCGAHLPAPRGIRPVSQCGPVVTTPATHGWIPRRRAIPFLEPMSSSIWRRTNAFASCSPDPVNSGLQPTRVTARCARTDRRVAGSDLHRRWASEPEAVDHPGDAPHGPLRDDNFTPTRRKRRAESA
jgi:hypothetical protein